MPQVRSSLYYSALFILILLSDNVYIVDIPRIRKVTISTGIITTIAGSTGVGGFSGDDGAATSAKLSQPYGVAVDSAGTFSFIFLMCIWSFLQ